MAEEKHYKFFCHRECEYFPCHSTQHPEDFNCLFCYCPLLFLSLPMLMPTWNIRA